MIDARRWVLVEAWLSLGLRVSWMDRYDAERVGRDEWMSDDETGSRYIYDGARDWFVAEPTGNRRLPGYANPDAPNLGTGALRHELAHYLTATEDERSKRNFGAKPTVGGDPAETEERALLAEQVIDAMLNASARVLRLSFKGGR